MAKKERTKKRRPAGAETVPTESGYPGPRQTPHPIRARLIGSARWQLTAKGKDCDPGQPESVIAAFESVGISGPYGVFYRVEEVSIEVRAAHFKDLAAGRLPPDYQPPREKYFMLPEDVLAWDGVKANVGVAELFHNRYSEFLGTFGTGVGKVEQWIALSHLAVYCLAQVRSPLRGVCEGFLWRTREADPDNDLVLAITSGPPILAAGENRDFRPESTNEPTLRTLSVAGQGVLVWAEAMLRLRSMFNHVDVLTRAQMKATASLFERRKPLLDWTGEDEALLAEVRRELIAFAPLWKKTSGEAATAEQKISFPAGNSSMPAMTLAHERMLLFLAKPNNKFRCLRVHETTKPETTRNREKAGKLLSYLKRCGYADTPHGPRSGYQITQPGLSAAEAIEKRRLTDDSPAQSRRK